MDEEAIRLSALHSLFDIILVHGIECFQEEKKSKKTGEVELIPVCVNKYHKIEKCNCVLTLTMAV